MPTPHGMASADDRSVTGGLQGALQAVALPPMLAGADPSVLSPQLAAGNVTPAAPGSAGAPPHQQWAFVFVDNSNIFIGAQRTASGIDDRSIRIDMQALTQVMVGELPTAKKLVCGVVKPSHQRVISSWKNAGFETRFSVSENRQDTHNGLEQCILNDILPNFEPQILILATGDGSNRGGSSFPKIATMAAKLGWDVRVWSWKHTLSRRFLEVERAEPQITVYYLDDFRDRIIKTPRQMSAASGPSGSGLAGGSPPLMAAAASGMVPQSLSAPPSDLSPPMQRRFSQPAMPRAAQHGAYGSMPQRRVHTYPSAHVDHGYGQPMPGPMPMHAGMSHGGRGPRPDHRYAGGMFNGGYMPTTHAQHPQMHGMYPNMHAAAMMQQFHQQQHQQHQQQQAAMFAMQQQQQQQQQQQMAAQRRGTDYVPNAAVAQAVVSVSSSSPLNAATSPETSLASSPPSIWAEAEDRASEAWAAPGVAAADGVSASSAVPSWLKTEGVESGEEVSAVGEAPDVDGPAGLTAVVSMLDLNEPASDAAVKPAMRAVQQH